MLKRMAPDSITAADIQIILGDFSLGGLVGALTGGCDS